MGRSGLKRNLGDRAALMRMKPAYVKLNDVLIFSAFILILIISLQNTGIVTIEVLFWKISMSRIILIPFVLFIGFLMGFVVGQKTKR